MKIVTKCPRDITKRDNYGDVAEMFFHPPLVKIKDTSWGEVQAICVEGKWFVPADDITSQALEVDWKRADKANDRSLELGIAELLRLNRERG